MAGEFTAATIPPLAGAYFDFEAQPQEPTIVNTNGVAAIPFVHNWGPANQVVKLNSFGDFINTFGQGGTPYSPGYIAVREAFDGEGLPGRGGAAQVLAYRLVGSAGAFGTTTLSNTTPATAITLSSKYKGSWASNITVNVIATPSAPSTSTDIRISVQGLLAETYSFANTAISAAVSAINASSQWVTATLGVDGVALTLPQNKTLTSGNDGSTLVSADWTTAFAAYGSQEFAVFAPYDLTDSSILASLVAWAGSASGGLNATGKRCEVVTGGALNESAATASTRAHSIDDPNFVTIGVGSVTDSLLGTLSTSQLAPRLAGIIAARGGRQGLTFARLARVTIAQGAVYSDILSGITNGFMTLGQDSNQAAPVRFEKGVTTYTDAGNPAKPVSVFGNPKFMITMQEIERELTEFAESNVIGIMPVNDATVNYLINYLKGYLRNLQNSNLIQPGYTVARATVPAPTPQDDFVALNYQILFGRDVEKVLNTVVVG